MKIQENILEILKQCETEENILFLPNIQLERKDYVAVNKCLEAIGGKWNKKRKGHIFESDCESIFCDLLESGEYIDIKKEFQFFETPLNIVMQMVLMANIKTNHRILEPSAGQGAIINHIPEFENYVACVELNPDNLKVLIDEYNVDDFWRMNFLDFECDEDIPKFDRIIMNPPFRNQQDIDHITHALENCLADGGILVSIVSESPFFRTTKKAEAFRNLLEKYNAEVIELPVGAFKSSGTNVKTRIIKIVKEL